MRVLLPVVWIIQKVSHVLKPDRPVIAAPKAEVGHLAQMSVDEGSILPMEAELIQHALKLNDVMTAEIITPRSVVMRHRSNITRRKLADEMTAQRIRWTNSRIPRTDGDNDNVCHLVKGKRADVIADLIRDNNANSDGKYVRKDSVTDRLFRSRR